jgi:hypothetical protein
MYRINGKEGQLKALVAGSADVCFGFHNFLAQQWPCQLCARCGQKIPGLFHQPPEAFFFLFFALSFPSVLEFAVSPLTYDPPT